ncbi:MAG TPA: hypothetical protein VGB56_00240, partial [Flavisolibacter sp.]
MSKIAHFLLLLFCLAAFSTTRAQTHTPRYIAMTSKTSGYYEYLPAGYVPGDGVKYPVIVYIHGNSERGLGDSVGLLDISGGGLPKVMREPDFPTSFISGKKEYRFIVISPQFRPRPTDVDVDSVLNYVLGHYPVDSSRIYLTGFSMGGGSCWDYAGSNPAFANKIAAMVPLSGSGTPDTVKTRIIAAANLPVWAFHNSGDGTVPVATTNTYIEYINTAPAPTPLAKATIFSSTSHSSWRASYNPDFREDSLNVFEWMLQFQRPPLKRSNTINVSIYGGRNPFNNTAWNNWNVASSLNSEPLKYSDFAESSVTAALSDGNVITDNGILPTSEMAPAPVLRYASSSSTGRTLTLGGLSASKTYNIELFASSNNTGNTTVFEAGGHTIAIVTDTNKTNIASFLQLQPTQEGQVIIGIQNSGAFNYLNGFTIRENGAKVISRPPPVAHAGADQQIFITDSVVLKGSGDHLDSATFIYHWTQEQGPGSATISSPFAATTTISG